MSYFIGITSVSQLKLEYRRLASKYHPDKGGDSRQMQEINSYYEHARKKLLVLERLEKRRQKIVADALNALDFSQVKLGETVFVNGTEGEVIDIAETSFCVLAKGRSRQAIFNKQGGKGKYNPRLNASYDNRHKKRVVSAAA